MTGLAAATLLLLAAQAPRLPAPGATAMAPAAQAPPLAVTVDAAAGHRPIVRAGALLAELDLADAVRSGVPLHLRFRVELWRDGFFDDLVAGDAWTADVLYQPLEAVYRLRFSDRHGRRLLSLTSYEDVRAALERAYGPALRPHRPGSYYYTAELDIETLSLSDLEELERWLKGELGPAVRGDRPVPSAIGQGAKRLLIRVLGLPSRRLRARSARFDLPG